jgi:hypothetical protein
LCRAKRQRAVCDYRDEIITARFQAQRLLRVLKAKQSLLKL